MPWTKKRHQAPGVVLSLSLAFLFLGGVLHAKDEPPPKPAPPLPSLKSFFPDLKHDCRNLFVSANLEPLLIGAGIGGATSVFDERIENYYRDHRRWGRIARVGDVLGNGYLAGGVIGTMLFSSGFSHNAEYRILSLDLAEGCLLNSLITTGLKHAISRQRPNGSDNYSFPSGHTSNAFTVAAILDEHYGHKIGLGSYAMASFIGWSRLQTGHHHLSDVVAGATLGTIVGRTVAGNHNPRKHRKLQWAPYAPYGLGAGASFSVSF